MVPTRKTKTYGRYTKGNQKAIKAHTYRKPSNHKEREQEKKGIMETKSQKTVKEEFQRNTTSASLTALKPLTVWVTTKCGKF